MIEGLREALIEEQAEDDKRDAVAKLLATAQGRLDDVLLARSQAVKRAATGHSVDFGKIDRDVAAAAAAVDLYGEAMTTATKTADRAAGEVIGLLRGEMQRRAQAAQATLQEARRELNEAARKHALAGEASAQAAGALQHYPSDRLRDMFQKDISECHEKENA